MMYKITDTIEAIAPKAPMISKTILSTSCLRIRTRRFYVKGREEKDKNDSPCNVRFLALQFETTTNR